MDAGRRTSPHQIQIIRSGDGQERHQTVLNHVPVRILTLANANTQKRMIMGSILPFNAGVSPSQMASASGKRWEGQVNKIHMVLFGKEREMEK